MAAANPTRLIICVDGTWFDPDGGANKAGNITNIYRLYASIKKGECQDSSGARYIQEKHYVYGIGSEDTISKYEKNKAGLFGLKCFDQIKNVYRECCRLNGPNDEVWLYGFSRGAQECADEYQEAGRPVTEDACKKYADEELEKCVTRLKKGIQEHKGRYAMALATSKFDRESIMSLNDATLELIKSDADRLRYVAAQVLDLDKKRQAAIQSVMSLYRRIIRSAALTAGIPGGPTANRSTAIFKVCQTVLRSFGIPTLTWETTMSIMKQNLPEDVPNMIGSVLMEGLTTLGVLGTIVTGGMPVVLAPVVINALPMAHMNAQVFLLLACDLILIFSRAYQEASMTLKGKPDESEVEGAAQAYRQHFRAVHFDVKDIVPDGFGVFRSGSVKARMEDLIDRWVPIVTESAGNSAADGYREEHRDEEENVHIERPEPDREDGEESEDYTDDGEKSFAED